MAAQKLIALVHFPKLFGRHQVYVPDAAHLLAQSRQRGAQLAARPGLVEIQLVLRQIQAVGLPEVAQRGPNLGGDLGVA